MHDLPPRLDWLDQEAGRMGELVAAWANVPSGSRDVAGLARMRAVLAETFGQLAPVEEVVLPDRGVALRLRRRPAAPRQVLLVGHFDTVFGPGDPFHAVLPPDPARPGILRGPGVADMKGGLVVLWHALAALEGAPETAADLGWEVILNPDEELGSPGSRALLAEAAGRHRVGLVFEPALPDGGLASARKGSGNFTVVAHGRAAHAGRDFAAGRNAIAALAAFIVGAHGLNGRRAGVTVNVGAVTGGGALNVVPDAATCRLNVRTVQPEDEAWAWDELGQLVRAAATDDAGVRLELSGEFTSPPKPADPRVDALLDALAGCAAELGQRPLTRAATGGTCDGNRLLASGLPNVDNLGPRGGGLHSPDEWIELASLPERARLTARFLGKLATGAFPP